SVTSPSSTPRWLAIFCARTGCDRPANTISRFHGPRSIQWPGSGSVTGPVVSNPGSESSVVPVLIGVSLFVDLLCASDRQGAGRDVLGDDRPRRDPSIVANLDRSNECILDAGPDVVSDLGRALRPALLVREVHGDVPRRDVRAFADLCVAEVGEVRHLGALADVRVLELHECSSFRPRRENRAGAKVTE